MRSTLFLLHWSLSLVVVCAMALHLTPTSVASLQEITRRVNLQDIWQAAYTAGVVLPKPVASCRYWHRSLNPKKLIEVGFSALQVRIMNTHQQQDSVH